jgi:hypothetical protein
VLALRFRRRTDAEDRLKAAVLAPGVALLVGLVLAVGYAVVPPGSR